MEDLNFFERAGFSKEESEGLMNIAKECGVSYEVVVNLLQSLREMEDIERAIREHNSKGY